MTFLAKACPLLCMICLTIAACGTTTRGQELGGHSSGGELAAAPQARVITLTEKDHGRRVFLPSSVRLVIRLEALPGTGYSWQIAKNTIDELELARAPFFEQAENPGVGGPVIQVFSFVRRNATSGELELQYRRPWEKDVAPEKVFRVTVGPNEREGMP